MPLAQQSLQLLMTASHALLLKSKLYIYTLQDMMQLLPPD
jgi:hypothetical protein